LRLRCSGKDISEIKPVGKAHARTLFRKILGNSLDEHSMVDLLQALGSTLSATTQAAAYIGLEMPHIRVWKYSRSWYIRNGCLVKIIGI